MYVVLVSLQHFINYDIVIPTLALEKEKRHTFTVKIVIKQQLVNASQFFNSYLYLRLLKILTLIPENVVFQTIMRN